MATYFLGRGDDRFLVDDDDLRIFARAGNDTIEGSGDRLLIEGGRGADEIGWVFGDNITAGGGLGDDQIRIIGQHNALYGRGGDDHLRAEGGNGSLYGGAGDDTIDAGYGGRFLARGGSGDDSITGAGSNSELYGGTGDDIVRLAEGSNNRLYGGVGDDTLSGSTLESHNNTLSGGVSEDDLTARDSRNVLDGGQGDDRPSSVMYNWLHEVGDGTTMRGGSGEDSFYFENPIHLSVTGDANSSLSQGDVIAGGIDQVTDYQVGETIDLFGQEFRRVASVGLADPADFDAPGGVEGHRHVALDAQTYAVFRGQLRAPGEFQVSATGDDTIVVYSADYGPGDVSTGAVVLENYTGDVLIV